MLAVFGFRDYRLLFVGMSASIIGDSLLLLVLAIWAKELTAANSAAGLVLMFFTAPMLLSPLAGLLVDRLPHRPFLVWANLGNAVALLPLAAVNRPGDVWLLCVVATLLGIGATLDVPALNGLLKKLLPEHLLVQSNGATQTVRQGIRLIGPLVGAAIYVGFGGFTVAVLDAVSFGVAAATNALLRIRESRRPPVTTRWRSEVAAGVQFVVADPSLRYALAGLALSGLGLGALESTMFALNDSGLGRPAEFVGVIVAVSGVGGLLGGLIAAKLVRRLGELFTLAISLFLLSATFLTWTVPNLALVLAVAPLAGLALSLLMVADNTLVQRRAPLAVIGRVSAANEMLFSVPYTFSLGIGALLVTVVDYRLLMLGMAASVLCGGLWLYRGRNLSDPAGYVYTLGKT